MEPPGEDCLLSDMLWADPAKGSEKDKDYQENFKRGMSFVFGVNPVNKILVNEGLKSIVRAHECKQDGYKFHMWNGEEEFPPVITVFSAPNYCGTHDNKAGILISEDDEIDVRVFKERQDKPYNLMNNPQLDAFSFFHVELFSHTIDFFLNVCKDAITKVDPNLSDTISSSASPRSPTKIIDQE